MKALLTWAAAASAFVAAVLWLGATIVKVDYKPVVGDGGAAIVRTEGSREIDILESAERQTWWNRWAALATAISALCQGISLLLSH